ncbi:MAG: hypothetical protein D6E12_15985 [Desulfovibrio sp.]|nr:MAG: hypothetical protein D6E12_15985 [Desulfovibrio sp.]
MPQHDQKPPSSVAGLAFILGISSLVISIGDSALSSVLRLPFSWHVPLLSGALALGAIIIGFIGIPHTSARSGRSGRPKAVNGLVMGYVCLGLTLFLYPGIVMPEIMEMQDNAQRTIQEVAITEAMNHCDVTLAEALLNGEEFSCADAQADLSTSGGLTVTIVQNGPNSCLISAIA